MSIQSQIHGEANRMVELANAMEISAQNNKWEALAVLVPEMIECCLKTTAFVAGIDPMLAAQAADKVKGMGNRLMLMMGTESDEEAAQAKGGGSVAFKPSI